MRCWFNGINDWAVAAAHHDVPDRSTNGALSWVDVFNELFRVTRTGGYVAFEVGELRKGTMKLEEYVIPLGKRAGFTCEAVFINTQNFTKTANIWGIQNNRSGTNTNRIVLFRK